MTALTVQLRADRILLTAPQQEVPLPVLAWTPHLKLHQSDGSFADEYRVRAGRVEVRALDRNGEPYPGYSHWTALTPEEIRLHFVKGTAVACWLKSLPRR